MPSGVANVDASIAFILFAQLTRSRNAGIDVVWPQFLAVVVGEGLLLASLLFFSFRLPRSRRDLASTSRSGTNSDWNKLRPTRLPLQPSSGKPNWRCSVGARLNGDWRLSGRRQVYLAVSLQDFYIVGTLERLGIPQAALTHDSPDMLQ